MIAEPAPVDLEAFRLRVRGWFAENMSRSEASSTRDGLVEITDEEALARTAHARRLQRKLFDAGFAGICVPREYGGQGMTSDHQRVFNEEIEGYEMPSILQVPTMSPCAAVILDFGTDEQKRRHIPAILRGDEVWVQLLSEPSGGSDVAGALTTAVRDGDSWVVNGSKIWTSGAWRSDWGLLLARTNWDVPKHEGLTVFMVQLHQPGIEIARTRMLNGASDFCQEYFTDVRIPDTDRIGEVDDGWTVGTRWMYHERAVKAGASSYVSRPISSSGGRQTTGGVGPRMLQLALHARTTDDAHVRQLIGEAHTLAVVGREMAAWIADGIQSGVLTAQAAAIARLYSGAMEVRHATIAFELSGAEAVAWDTEDQDIGDRGIAFLLRQRHCIGGGTVEMSRNVVSERVLGFPREVTGDRNRPFREVHTNTPAR